MELRILPYDTAIHSAKHGNTAHMIDFLMHIFKLQKYCVVSRVPIQFTNGLHWVYMCDCTQDHCDFVRALSTDLPHSFEGEFCNENICT